MGEILHISFYQEKRGWSTTSVSKSLMKHFGLKAGDCVSFAQDTRMSKQFYLVIDDVDLIFRCRICKQATNYNIHNKSLTNYIYNALNLSKDYHLRFLVSKKPKVIDGVKVYPLMLDDCIHKRQKVRKPQGPTVELLQLFRQGKQVLLDNIRVNEAGRMSFTDLWKLTGRPINRTPHKWQMMDESKKIIKALSTKLQADIPSIFLTRRGGKDAGTWAHKTLFLSYAEYIDPALGTLVREAFERTVSDDIKPISKPI
jgi:hypothetical protein